jgi:hypothetical protein
METNMKKNLYALKLAGLLKEQVGPPMPQDNGEGGGGGDQGADDPAALLDQAIDLLNKVKEALGGGAGVGAGGPPPDMGASPDMGSPPPQGM